MIRRVQGAAAGPRECLLGFSAHWSPQRRWPASYQLTTAGGGGGGGGGVATAAATVQQCEEKQNAILGAE